MSQYGAFSKMLRSCPKFTCLTVRGSANTSEFSLLFLAEALEVRSVASGTGTSGLDTVEGVPCHGLQSGILFFKPIDDTTTQNGQELLDHYEGLLDGFKHP